MPDSTRAWTKDYRDGWYHSNRLEHLFFAIENGEVIYQCNNGEAPGRISSDGYVWPQPDLAPPKYLPSIIRRDNSGEGVAYSPWPVYLTIDLKTMCWLTSSLDLEHYQDFEIVDDWKDILTLDP